MSQVVFAIPARFGSARLPGKPLLPLGEKTVLAHVISRVQQCAEQLRSDFSACHILVATDDERIAQEARRAGVRAEITSPDLPSGTDRIDAALAANPHFGLADSDLILNIQGDEPFFSMHDVCALARAMAQKPDVPMGTLAFRRSTEGLFGKSNVVKVVVDAQGFALYFSRAPIPWPRAQWGASGLEWVDPQALKSAAIPFLHHLGVYAFRRQSLGEFARALPKSSLELSEGLEQLRALEAGWRILVVPASDAPQGIDTPEDLAAARQRIGQP